MKGIKGIQGFVDKIDQERTKFQGKLNFPNLSSSSKWSGNTITVGTSGEMYPTISQAAASIPDASSDNQYALFITSGTYRESVQLPGFVHIFSVGRVTIVAPSGQPAISNAQGSINLFGLRLTSEDGTAGDLVMNDTDLIMLVSTIGGTLDVRGQSQVLAADVRLTSIAVSAGNQDISILTGSISEGIIKNATGEFRLMLVSCTVGGSILSALGVHKLTLNATTILNPLGVSPILLDPTGIGSFLRMEHCTLVGTPGVATIDRSVPIGALQVWTAFNLLSFGYAANVNENFAVTNNIIDPQVSTYLTFY